MSRKVIAFIAVALGLFVIACGSGSSGSSVTVVPGAAATSAPAAATDVPAAPAVAKVGDRVELEGMAFTVVKVDHKAALSDFQKAKDGNEFVVAEVLIENASSDKPVNYNLLYFKMRDADGFEYPSTIGVDQALSAGDLAKGEKARGNVAFEVKKGAKGLRLDYKPLTFSDTEAIKVSLE